MTGSVGEWGGAQRTRSAKWPDGLKDPIKPSLRRPSSRVTAKRQLLHTYLFAATTVTPRVHDPGGRGGGRVMNERRGPANFLISENYSG